MHLDEERIQRLLDGELAPESEASLREHLAACGECRVRVAEAEAEEAEVSGLLRHLDHAPSAVDAAAIAARARGRPTGGARWAAGILLALGAAGVAYAVPGSPLPGWVEAVTAWIAGDAEPMTSVTADPQAADPGVSGISIVPGEAFVIVFSTPQPEGRAIVLLVDAREVSVRAVGGAATFTSDLDRLVVDNGAATEFEIEIPRDAPRVEIRVRSHRIFLKESSVVTAVAADANGRYLLPLTLAGP